jgi:hypothetical protein
LKRVRVNGRVTFEYDETRVPDPDASWLSEWLASESATLQPGDFMRIGWMTNLLKEYPDGVHLNEPDFVQVPIAFVDSLTRTLVHLRRQRDVAESVRMDAMFPSIRDGATICDRLGREYVMHRRAPQPPDSGWFIGCADVDHDHDDVANLTMDSLYAVAIGHEKIVPFLALPPGCTVELYKDEFGLYFNDRTVSFTKGSYLDRLSNG